MYAQVRAVFMQVTALFVSVSRIALVPIRGQLWTAFL